MPNPNEMARIEEEEQAELPLAAPARPLLLNNTTLRLTFRPEALDSDKEPLPVALEFEADAVTVASISAKLQRGSVQIDFVNGFGRTRTLQLSPAELMLLLTQSDRFINELPR
jgi:hypothetical protein